MSRIHIDGNDVARVMTYSDESDTDRSRVEVIDQTLTLPGELLARYVSVAMGSARPLELDPGRWYAALDNFPGVWADGESPKACLDALAQVLEDWVILKIADRDRDLPVVDGIDLTVLCR